MAIVLGHAIDRSHYDYDHVFTGIDEPVHASTKALLEIWHACAAHGGMRMGRDIPSRDLAPFLVDLIVGEPVGDWTDMRIRLAGFGTAQYFGRDPSGALLSEIFASGETEMRRVLDGVRDAIVNNRPAVSEHVISDNGRVVLRQELSALPLLAPEGDARWVLIGNFNF